MADERVENLRRVAEERDGPEYSGWINLCQGALDVIAERDADAEQLREELAACEKARHEAIHLGEQGLMSGWKGRAEKAEADAERLREENRKMIEQFNAETLRLREALEESTALVRLGDTTRAVEVADAALDEGERDG